MPPAQALRSVELVERRIRIADADVVWLRSVLEGYDGLAALYGDGSGVVVLSTTTSQAAELDALLEELRSEAALLALDG